MSICFRIVNISNLLVAVKLPHISCVLSLTPFNGIIDITSGVKLARPIPNPSSLLGHIIRYYRLVERSQSPRVLRRESPAACLLGLQVRIPPGSLVSVSCKCCVLSGRSLCEGADHSSRGVLTSVVCLSVISKPKRRELCPLGVSSHKEHGYVL